VTTNDTHGRILPSPCIVPVWLEASLRITNPFSLNRS
jgi:hypothetical protein